MKISFSFLLVLGLCLPGGLASPLGETPSREGKDDGSGGKKILAAVQKEPQTSSTGTATAPLQEENMNPNLANNQVNHDVVSLSSSLVESSTTAAATSGDSSASGAGVLFFGNADASAFHEAISTSTTAAAASASTNNSSFDTVPNEIVAAGAPVEALAPVLGASSRQRQPQHHHDDVAIAAPIRNEMTDRLLEENEVCCFITSLKMIEIDFT